MVKHIVLWDFVEGLSRDEKNEAAKKMASLLEPIRDLVPGAVEIQVVQNQLSSSNRDIALISTFETLDALMTYQNHPAHVEAGKYVRSVTCNRSCMDYEFASIPKTAPLNQTV
ncbi:MAG TPA: stress protein [Lachnospiraceae bacterium]|nr:stress protein [Lachnospiraceae bacterium]